MDFSENLKYYRKYKGVTQKELADAIGTNNTTLSNWEKGISKPDIDTIIKLSNYFGISIDDLVFFKNEKNGNENGKVYGKVSNKNAQVNAQVNAQLLDEIEENAEHPNLCKRETKYSQTPKRHLIPFYDIQAIAGRYSGADMTPVIASTEMIDAGDWFHDATAAMRIYGDSMNPDYKSGTIVALKEVHDKRIILYGDDYVIETDEIRVLKRLQRADERGCWLACSTNQEIWEQGPQKGRLVHEPFEVPIDMVRRLYLVVGEVNRKHGNIINFNER